MQFIDDRQSRAVRTYINNNILKPNHVLYWKYDVRYINICALIKDYKNCKSELKKQTIYDKITRSHVIISDVLIHKKKYEKMVQYTHMMPFLSYHAFLEIIDEYFIAYKHAFDFLIKYLDIIDICNEKTFNIFNKHMLKLSLYNYEFTINDIPQCEVFCNNLCKCIKDKIDELYQFTDTLKLLLSPVPKSSA